MAVRKKGLGKGLDSLIPDNKPVKSVTAVKEEETEAPVIVKSKGEAPEQYPNWDDE